MSYPGEDSRGYVCSNPLCCRWFGTKKQWKLHGGRRHATAGKCVQQHKAVPLNEFLAQLAREGRVSTYGQEQLARRQLVTQFPPLPMDPPNRLPSRFFDTDDNGAQLYPSTLNTSGVLFESHRDEHEYDGIFPFADVESFDELQTPFADVESFNELQTPAHDRVPSMENLRVDGSEAQPENQPGAGTDDPFYEYSPLYPNPHTTSTPHRDGDVGDSQNQARPRSEPLYNPYDDGAEPAYIRIKTAEGIIYRHATAGGLVQLAGHDESRWHKLRRQNQTENAGCQWGRFKNQRDWEDVKWLVNAKASQTCLQDLLHTARFRNDPGGYGTVKQAFATVEGLEGVGGPNIYKEVVQLAEAPDDPQVLAYRCLEKSGDHIFGTARFAGNMAFTPEVKFDRFGCRQYDEVNSADHWNLRQRELPPGTTYGPGILMSDATQLSMFSGDVSAHGVYLSLGNVDKSVRADISQGAWLLVAIIPKSNWTKTLEKMPHLSKTDRVTLVNLLNRRLFHRCMEIITRPFRRTEPHIALDPEGHARLVQYEMAIYGADLQEQCDIAAITRNTCPQCHAKGAKLGDPACQHTRSSATILANINQVLRDFHSAYKRYPDPLEFLKAGKAFDLNGVQRPFWRSLPGVDICKVLSPDLLHGVHKYFFDHIHKWNLNSLGPEEYDTRLKSQPRVPGERAFPEGVSKLKQLSGKDYRALERVHMAIVANAPDKNEGGAGSRKLTIATRGIMDCVFLAQLPVHTERTLSAFNTAHETFHLNKQVWVENGSKRGKKGQILPEFTQPKGHILRHIPEHIRLKGPCENYNTETMEHLHQPYLKDPYRGSNRKDWIKQLIRWLARREKIREYGEFLVWNEAEDAREFGMEEEEVIEDAGIYAIDEEALDRLLRIDNNEADDAYEDVWGGYGPSGSGVYDDDGEEGVEDEDEGEGEGEGGAEAMTGAGAEAEADTDVEAEAEAEAEAEYEDRLEHEFGAFTQEVSCDDDIGTYGPGIQYNTWQELWEHREHWEHRELWESRELQEVQGLNSREVVDSREYNLIGSIGNGIHHVEMSIDDDSDPFPTTHLPLFRLAKVPNLKLWTIDALAERLGNPKLLHQILAHPYYNNLPVKIDQNTKVNIWNALYLTTPVSSHTPIQATCRIHAQSGLDGKDPRWDPIFYVPTTERGERTPEIETIHNYHVGLLALVFALPASDEVPTPRVMTLVQRFSSIPEITNGASGFYCVKKLTSRGLPRFEVIAASQLARPCPLAPRIKGPAERGVEGNQSSEHYDQFYINTYRFPRDFWFIRAS